MNKYISKKTIDKVLNVVDDISAVAIFLFIWMFLALIFIYILLITNFPYDNIYANSLGAALIIVGYGVKNGNIQINSMYWGRN